MPKLNQLVAVEKGLKGRTANALTAIYHAHQKPALYAGLERVYQPKDEEGEQLPPESTRVQRTVESDLEQITDLLTPLFDAVLTKEEGNRLAKADVVIGDKTLVKDASVPYLLFLEKQLADLRTVFTKLPTRDTSEVWQEELANTARTDVVQTHRTRKTPNVLVKAAATERHPAQTEVFMEDQIVGYWKTTKRTGAVDPARRDVLIGRVDALLDAVKQARETANGVEIQQKNGADALFEYLTRP